MDDEIANNRRYVRRSLKSRVTVVTGAGAEHVGTLVDVSEEGFGITCYQPCTPEAVYSLALMHLPDEHDGQRLADLEARCIWCRRISAAHYVSGFAVQTISDQARHLLDTLLQDHD
jgi:hypothetical protein